MRKQLCRLLAAAWLVSILSALPARAGSGRWDPYGPPAGSVISFAVHPSGRLLIVAEEGNVYARATESEVHASADGGRSWFWSGAGLGDERMRAVVVDPEDGDVYALGVTRFFRSTDQGRTWTVRAEDLALGEPNPVLGNDLLILAPGEPDTLFVARNKSLLRSRDGGLTWQSVDFHPETAIGSLMVDPSSPQSLFLGTLSEETGSVDITIPGGLFHSGNGGDTWTEVTQAELPYPGSPPAFSYGVFALSALPGSPTTCFALTGYGLYRSVDAGASWESVAPAPPPGDGYVYSLAVVPGSPGTLFSAQGVASNDGFAHSGIFSSQDSGTTWTRVDDGTLPIGTQDLFVAPNRELYTVSGSGFSRSVDGGAHWRHFRVGSQFCGNSSTYSSGSLLRWSRDGSRLYALVDFHLSQSNDGGRSWSTRAQSLSASCINVTDVQIDPSRSGALYASTDRGVYRSNDSGLTWTSTAPAGRPNALRSFHGLAIVPGGLLGAGCGVERSTDGGRSWRPTLSCEVRHFDDAPFSRFVTRLRSDPQRPQVVYAEVTEESQQRPQTVFRAVYRSKDGGLTWRRLAADSTLIAVDPRMTQTLYLVKRNGRLLRSVNDGRTWKAIATLGPDAAWGFDLLVDRADSQTLYSAGRVDVYRSLDGGVTWSPFGNGLRGVVGNLIRDPRRPVLYTGGGGLFEINVP